MADMTQIYGNSPFMNEMMLSQMQNTQVPFQPGYQQPNVSDEVQKGVEAALNKKNDVQVPYKYPNMPEAGKDAVKNQQLQWIDKQIEEKQAEITLIGKKIEELKQSITGVQSKYAPKQGSIDELERKMAANRARRIKKDDESMKQWRWKRELDQKDELAQMQYKWQQGQNNNEAYLGQMTARNEFNGALNSAISQWQAAKKSGDALAEAYAKEHVDQLIAFGQEKFGVDYKSKIKEAEELVAKNKETAMNQYNNWAALDKEKRGTNFNDPNSVTDWNEKVNAAWNEGKIDDKQRDNLYFVDKSETEKDSDATKGTSRDIKTDAQKAAAAAAKLTLDELLAKTSLNQYEETALGNKYTSAMRTTDVEAYKNMDKTDRKIWAKKNPGKFSFLQKKGLI